ncbi:hypothetical protein NE237_003428 [Protea cynaroides]|uniref:Reverse transcriptase RNase H-like domain-containing protein n=1 Tax=Protea cynaroides TaxID=273540 RepID=A0A9Q0KHF5_9MAGN|nr:hypothetical protein NE237_003428 [Protea cynaroides]
MDELASSKKKSMTSGIRARFERGVMARPDISKGLKKEESTYVASLREEEDIRPKKAQPQEIEAVLDEYKDIMPNEFSKKLPPRREVDHEIKLVSGAKLSAMEPYHMSPPELEELRRNLKELLDAGVLMQDGHPIAYESRKLNETERRYTVQEKEMTTVVHCLRTWRHYLLGSKFVVKTDNVATSYFQSQKKLSPKQARWQYFLAEFNMVLEYQPGRINQMAVRPPIHTHESFSLNENSSKSAAALECQRLGFKRRPPRKNKMNQGGRDRGLV